MISGPASAGANVEVLALARVTRGRAQHSQET